MSPDPLRVRLAALLVKMRQRVDMSDFSSGEHYAAYIGTTNHWADRLAAELAVPEGETPQLIAKIGGLVIDRDAELRQELRLYLDTLTINGDTIGDIRRRLFLPWNSAWNGWVREETANRERPVAARAAAPQEE